MFAVCVLLGRQGHPNEYLIAKYPLERYAKHDQCMPYVRIKVEGVPKDLTYDQLGVANCFTHHPTLKWTVRVICVLI